MTDGLTNRKTDREKGEVGRIGGGDRRTDGLTDRRADGRTYGRTENMDRLTYTHLNTQMGRRTNWPAGRKAGSRPD